MIQLRVFFFIVVESEDGDKDIKEGNRMMQVVMVLSKLKMDGLVQLII